jgi:hypothetical protein
MIPMGYMAKFISDQPAGLHCHHVKAIYSVSSCISEDFCDWINEWKHNGYWMFNSPKIILDIARRQNIDLTAATLCYYELYEYEYDSGAKWLPCEPEPSWPVKVDLPQSKAFRGFDITTFSVHTSVECSPLSCNELCAEIRVNSCCLLDSFEEAKALLESGKLENSEPGPYRIISVSTVPWELTDFLPVSA